MVFTEIAKYRMRLLKLDGLLIHFDVNNWQVVSLKPMRTLSLILSHLPGIYVSELLVQGRKSTAHLILTVANSLCDYFGNLKVEIDPINSIMLPDYEGTGLTMKIEGYKD